MKKGWIFLILLWAGVAEADWSPEIVIWQPPDTSFFVGYLEATMKIDGSEHVHIVHSYRRTVAYEGLRYVQLDNFGHILTTHFISDSADIVATYQRIVFFGQDSLWVIWRSANPNEPSAYKIRPLDLQGNLLGPPRIFQPDTLGAIGLAADVRQSDRAVALVNPRWETETEAGGLWATVELPSGERTLNAARIWTSILCDQPDGFIDFTDSLQIVWREAYYDWQAVFGKRISTLVPFDSMHMANHVELTPARSGYYHVAPVILSVDTTKLLLKEWNISVSSQQVWVLDRDNYDSLAFVQAGPYSGTDEIGIEGDTVAGLPVYDPDNYQIRIKRFTLPDFQLRSNEVVATRPSPFGAIGCNGYATSPAGERHVLLFIQTSAHATHLSYRYWRSDLSLREPRAPGTVPVFAISPNPSPGSITLTGPIQHIREIKVYDLLGRFLETVTLNTQNKEADHVALSLTSLPAGTYFLHINAGQHMVLQKIVLLR